MRYEEGVEDAVESLEGERMWGEEGAGDLYHGRLALGLACGFFHDYAVRRG